MRYLILTSCLCVGLWNSERFVSPDLYPQIKITAKKERLLSEIIEETRIKYDLPKD
jgi:hypothetical protein